MSACVLSSCAGCGLRQPRVRQLLDHTNKISRARRPTVEIHSAALRVLKRVVQAREVTEVVGQRPKLRVVLRCSRLDVAGKRRQAFNRDGNAVGVEGHRRSPQFGERPPPVAHRLPQPYDRAADERVGQEMKPLGGLIKPAIDDRHGDLRG